MGESALIGVASNVILVYPIFHEDKLPTSLNFGAFSTNTLSKLLEHDQDWDVEGLKSFFSHQAL